MLFRGLIHNKQAMCYSSQKKGHEDRKLFFLPKYEKYILQSRTNQLMTSRVLASPRAAWNWHHELTQSPPTLLPTFPPGEGLAAGNLPGSFLFSIVERRYCGLPKFYRRKPQNSATQGFTSFIHRVSQCLSSIPSFMHGMTDQSL